MELLGNNNHICFLLLRISFVYSLCQRFRGGICLRHWSWVAIGPMKLGRPLVTQLKFLSLFLGLFSEKTLFPDKIKQKSQSLSKAQPSPASKEARDSKEGHGPWLQK